MILSRDSALYQIVWPDLDSNCLAFSCFFGKNFSKKMILKDKSKGQKSIKNYPLGKELTLAIMLEALTCHMPIP